MSSGICRSCKNESSCTFPRNQTIAQCEEYEYAEPRAADTPAPSAKATDAKREVAVAR